MATITKSDQLRLHNRSRILSCLRRNGSQSRTFVGESTGLSGATVTQITADLIDNGVIEEMTPALTSGAVNTRRGRPQVILQLNSNAATTAVLTLLLNEIEVTLYDYSGARIHRCKTGLVTAKLTLSTLKKYLFKSLDNAFDAVDLSNSPLKHIACVCQGTVTRDCSGLLWSPITKLRDVELRNILQSRYGVSVTVHNDCKVIAAALYNQRQTWSESSDNTIDEPLKPTEIPKASQNNFAVLLSSYGIGLGYFHEGDIVAGSRSSGTEFGHMLHQADGALCRCGRRGCIEAYSSHYAIWRKAHGNSADSLPEDSIPADEYAKLVATAMCGPGPERQAFEEAGAAFGQGLSNLFAIFDPFPVMMVGVSTDAFDLMRPSIMRTLQHYGAVENESSVSVYERSTERELLSIGASLQSLSYLDKEIFAFGETLNVPSPVAS